jgi:hypothetical protein
MRSGFRIPDAALPSIWGRDNSSSHSALPAAASAETPGSPQERPHAGPGLTQYHSLGCVPYGIAKSKSRFRLLSQSPFRYALSNCADVLAFQDRLRRSVPGHFEHGETDLLGGQNGIGKGPA